MRLLSKVIKNSNLFVSQPLLLKSFDQSDPLKDHGKEAECSNLSQLDQEREEVDFLRDESKKILAETEQIVMDLLEKARSEAREIIGTAQDEADLIKSEVYEEARQLRQESAQKGYEEGRIQIEQEMKDQKQVASDQIQSIIAEAYQEKLNILQSCDKDILQLAMTVARKIITTELSIQPQLIMDVVRQAISFLDQPEQIEVYVNPLDLQILMDSIQLEGLDEVGNSEMKVDLKSDRRISPGGCIVKSDAGRIDAQLELRIDRIEDSLKKAVGSI